MSEQDRDPHAMVGAYVADALDDDERLAFEQHLAGCESCRREVAEFTETAAELSRLTETPPPAALRASVLAEIATVRPLPPEEALPSEEALPPGQAGASERTVARSTAAEIATAPTAGSGAISGRGSIDELALRRQQRIRRVLTGLVAAALVVVVALGGWVTVLVSEQRAQQVAAQRVNELLTAPDATVYATQLNGANVSYVVSEQRDEALFVGDDVRSPGTDKVYQLWTISGDEPATSRGLLPGADVVTHWFAGPLGDAQVMAVTVEPAGGSPQPTTTPLAVVEL